MENQQINFILLYYFFLLHLFCKLLKKLKNKYKKLLRDAKKRQ